MYLFVYGYIVVTLIILTILYMLDLRSELNVVQTKPTNTALSLAPKEDSSSNAIPIKKKQDPMEENSINDKSSSLSTPPNRGKNLFALV